MKIYIAAKYERRHELLESLDAPLRKMGHETTSRWLHGETGDKVFWAQADADDVLAADAIILVSQHDHPLKGGGGRHFEFGLAYGAQKRLILIGEREIIFHHLPGVEVHDTIPEFLSFFAVEDALFSSPHDTEARD